MQLLTTAKSTHKYINGGFYLSDSIIKKQIPDQDNELMPGIKWGNYCQLYTPAFWKYMYLLHASNTNFSTHRLGANIIEEVIACLLGGYGMPSEIGILAFQRLKEESLIVQGISYDKIESALLIPFKLEDGSLKRYRFFRQKSKYIYKFLQRNDLDEIPILDDNLLRTWLLTIEGVGYKTASWITRNWLQSENVAILDIHILRAGKIAGLFDETDKVSTRYVELENDYIEFCKALKVQPSNMDAIIWGYMKKTNKLALKVLSCQ